ncbi:MAG: PDDEXK family nuclease [Candidatus Aquicultorales bacterium]
MHLGEGDTNSQASGESQIERTRFAHPSEEQCARILEFYHLKWEYEPKTFPIEWDKKGNVIQSFSPDFYLPELDLYLELTTMSQKLVTKKNRKVRRLRELYPDINVKIFYQRDFKSLLIKYGLKGPAN